MWAWILAAVVTLGAWAAYWFFNLALWIPIVVTVGAVLFVVGFAWCGGSARRRPPRARARADEAGRAAGGQRTS